MGTSENNVSGNLAELRFMLRATEEGFNVSQPVGSQLGYDFITEYEGNLNRVNVKSANYTQFESRKHRGRTKRYQLQVSKGGKKEVYTSDDIDFIVGYISVVDRWYVFPVHELNVKSVSIGIVGPSKWDKYVEAWELLKYG